MAQAVSYQSGDQYYRLVIKLIGKRIWFGGDTGYRYVPEGANEDDMPICPAFKEIGEKFGPFDISL